MNLAKKLLPLFAALLFLTSCSSSPPDVGKEQEAAVLEGRSNNSGKIETVTTGNLVSSTLPREITDPKNILSKRSIYFDYDSFDIKSEYKDLVGAHARFLNERRHLKILVQGHTDERGGREYNLALGQKRADAVKKALLLLGVREEQLESVSLGKEKPKNIGHDEAAWAENRRADIVYVGEQ